MVGQAIIQSSQQKKLVISKDQFSQFSRAGYTIIQQGMEIPRQIEIYSKIGTSTRYHQCLPGKTKKIKSANKNRKNVMKKKKNSSDDQYYVKSQKKDRNVTSNLIHHLIKFLLLTRGQKEIVNKIISFHKISMTYELFFQQLEKVSRILKTYVTLNHIQNLWFDETPQAQQFCLIMRVLSKMFYSKAGFLSIFFSNKFNKASKQVHFKGVKSLIEVLIHKDLEQLKLLS